MNNCHKVMHSPYMYLRADEFQSQTYKINLPIYCLHYFLYMKHLWLNTLLFHATFLPNKYNNKNILTIIHIFTKKIIQINEKLTNLM